jgi:hypothetical protein
MAGKGQFREEWISDVILVARESRCGGRKNCNEFATIEIAIAEQPRPS